MKLVPQFWAPRPPAAGKDAQSSDNEPCLVGQGMLLTGRAIDAESSGAGRPCPGEEFRDTQNLEGTAASCLSLQVPGGWSSLCPPGTLSVIKVETRDTIMADHMLASDISSLMSHTSLLLHLLARISPMANPGENGREQEKHI